MKKELVELKNPLRAEDQELVDGNVQAHYENDQESATFSPNLYYGCDE